jgi:hypothetical protein
MLAAASVYDNSALVFSVSSAGVLTPVPGSPFATGHWPESVSFSPSGGLLAVANAYGDSVSMFSVHASTAEPSAQITSPSDGATYTLGQLVYASFGCLEGAGGPGLASCIGTVPNDTPIDTTTLGQHTFTVTGTSTNGQQATSTATYTVQPNNQIAVSHVSSQADGTTNFQVKVPGPGTIDMLQTAWDDNLVSGVTPQATGAGPLPPALHRFVFARASAPVTSGDTVSITVAPYAVGKELVNRHRYRVTLRLWVTYTPTGGTQTSVGFYGLHLGSGCAAATSNGGRTKTNCSGN